MQVNDAFTTEAQRHGEIMGGHNAARTSSN